MLVHFSMSLHQGNPSLCLAASPLGVYDVTLRVPRHVGYRVIISKGVACMPKREILGVCKALRYTLG